jgi:hypothetical protein
MERNKKGLRQDTWTGRFANMFYSIDKSNPNSLQAKKCTKHELKLLQRDLNYITRRIHRSEAALIGKLDSQQLPLCKVIVDNDEYPNMYADCKKRIIYITSGLIREVFKKTFKVNFSKDNILSFSKLAKNSNQINTDSSLYIFLNLLYNLKIGKVNMLSALKDDDDDTSFDNMETYWSLVQTIQFADKELIKILAFLISHEYYHVITNCKKCSNTDTQVETEADAFGILQYFRMNESVITEALFEDFVGRPLPQIFHDIYVDFPVHDACYLPFDARVKKLDSTLTILQQRAFQNKGFSYDRGFR